MYVTSDTSESYYQTASNIKNSGYGGMAYYSSATCNGSEDSSGCTTDYAQSEIKYVVDAWKVAQASGASEARLITDDEYFSNCIEEEYQSSPSGTSKRIVQQYDWLYNNDYQYWTMSQYNDSLRDVWYVNFDGNLAICESESCDAGVNNYQQVVRPVIVLPKSALTIS